MHDITALIPFIPADLAGVRPNLHARVLGIDLGTTNSAVAEAYWRGDGSARARCLEVDQPVDSGTYTNVIVPSVVVVRDGPIVGEHARRLRSEAGEHGLRTNRDLFVDCKNDMGVARTYHQAPVGYRSAPEIATHILRFLRAAALADDPTLPARTVVTVPASFQVAQRRHTLDAAEAAGLTIAPGDLLDEPVAAFIDYLVTQGSSGLGEIGAGRRLLVFDFGGGTCDIAVFRLESAQGRPSITPLAVSRYHRLGGGDIDAAVVHEVLLAQLLAENGLTPHDLGFDDKKYYVEPALLGVAEALKKGLCSEIRHLQAFGRYDAADKATIVKVQPGLHRVWTKRGELTLTSPRLTAAEFDAVLAPFLDEDLLYPRENEYKSSCSILAPITDALDRAGLEPGDIDLCLLVGGSSAIPQVEACLRRHFASARMLTHVDPEDVQCAVARGAAYHALALSVFGRSLFQPVAADDLSIRTSAGLLPLVTRGTPLPTATGSTAPRNELAIPKTALWGDCRLRIEIVAGTGEQERVLHSAIWDVPASVTRGDGIILTAALDENQVLSIIAALADAPEAPSLSLTIENPLTHVVNPLRARLRVDEQEEALRTGAIERTKTSEALVDLADSYRELRQREKALELLQRAALAAGAPDGNILNKMGVLHGELGDFARQEKVYREAAAVAEWSGPLFNLALAQYRRREYDKAAGTIAEAIALEDEPGYLVLQGLLAGKRGRDSEKSVSLARASASMPPVTAMDDFTLHWAGVLASLLRDTGLEAAVDVERRRRAKDDTQPISDEGLLPDLRGTMRKAVS